MGMKVIITVLTLLVLMLVGVQGKKPSTEERNLKVIKEAYGAFIAGDVPALLSKFASNYDIKENSAAKLFPGYGDFKNNAIGYLTELSTLEFSNIQVRSFLTNKNQVDAVIEYDLMSKLTGKKKHFVHNQLWTLDKAGKITEYFGFPDTASQIDLTTIDQTPYGNLAFLTANIAKFNSDNWQAAFDDYAPDAKLTFNLEAFSVEEYKVEYAALRASFPDIYCQIVKLVGDNNYVTQQLIITGTFNGAPYNGLPPTGKTFRVAETIVSTVKDGKIIAEDSAFDLFGLLTQIGA